MTIVEFFAFLFDLEQAVKEDRESRIVKVGLLYVFKTWGQLPFTRLYPKAPNLEVAFVPRILSHGHAHGEMNLLVLTRW